MLNLNPDEQRVALVTGGGKGIGAGIVRILESYGVRCCINCSHNPAMANALCEELKGEGKECFVYQADISNPDEVEAMVQEIIDRYGRLDILVNNAAVQPNKFIDEYDVNDLKWIWDTNIGGYCNAARAVWPYITKSPMPTIVNISSVHAKRPTCFDCGYAMTKGAIRMLTRELALDIFNYGGTCNALELGAVYIEFKSGQAEKKSDAPIVRPLPGCENEEISRRLAHEQHVRKEEIGEMVWFLCNEGGRGFNGAGLRMDKGHMLVV